LPAGGTAQELALVFDAEGVSPSADRVLIVPALFDEGNKMRRFTVEVMRRLAAAGIGSVLPDLPGCNESRLPLETQSPGDWQLAMEGALRHFGCTHALSIRGGALVAPHCVPGWRYARVAGASQLRQMMRARILMAREAGHDETQDSLLAIGAEHGLELAGYALGPDFIREFPGLIPDAASPMVDVGQDMVGGPGLWLRAEPDEDPAQSDALAAIIAVALRQVEPAQ
jgi:hypothetical protein